MSDAIHTPADLAISPRDYAFGRETSASRWWLGDDPAATAFYDALSATFPQGERFFMDAVRHYRHRVSPDLSRQIGAFLSQEAVHTREHIFFNRQIAAHGFDVAAMEARVRAILDFARSQDPLEQLAATAALEHFTAILAHAVLSDPRHLAPASDEARAMWRWHALEEIEHKAVAFDTLVAASAGLHPGKRWLMRTGSMIVATQLLFSTVGANMGEIFAAAGLDARRTWRKTAGFLLLRPGILRQVAGAYLAYFLPGFHPWKLDDRALAAQAAASLAGREAQAAA